MYKFCNLGVWWCGLVLCVLSSLALPPQRKKELIVAPVVFMLEGGCVSEVRLCSRVSYSYLNIFFTLKHFQKLY